MKQPSIKYVSLLYF